MSAHGHGHAPGHLSSTSSSGAGPLPVRSTLKRFTHAQIADKVRSRTNVPDYYDLLMSCAVEQDAEGVQFDSSAPGWKELVKKCAIADQKDREKKKKELEQQHQQQASPTPTVTPSASNATTLPSEQPAAASSAPASAASPSSTGSFLSKVSALITSKPETPQTRPSSTTSSTVPGGSTLIRQTELQQEGQPPEEDWIDINKHHKAERQKSHHPAHAASHQPMRRPASAANTLQSKPKLVLTTTPATGTPAASTTAVPSSHATDPLSSHSAENSPSHATESTNNIETSASSHTRPVVPLHSSTARPSSTSTTAGTSATTTSGAPPSHPFKTNSSILSDLSFETRLTRELQEQTDQQALARDWKERRLRVIQRERERKLKEEAEELQQRLARSSNGTASSGGSSSSRKKKKVLVLAGPVVYDPLSGLVIDEWNYYHVLLTELTKPSDEEVDWQLVRSIGAIVGLPHKYRCRVWEKLLVIDTKQSSTTAWIDGLELGNEQHAQPWKSSFSPASVVASAASAPVTVPEPVVKEKVEEKEAEDLKPGVLSPVDTGLADIQENESDTPPTIAAADPSAISTTATASTDTASTAPRTPPPSATSAAASAFYADPSTSPLPTITRLDPSNQRVIHVDIDRTLPHLTRLQLSSIRHDMEQLLITYALHTGHHYKQGQNYLLAPFFFLFPLSPTTTTTTTTATATTTTATSHASLSSSLSPFTPAQKKLILKLYVGLIQNFLPSIFMDDEFLSLQMIFVLFRFLLLSHDPALCLYLDRQNMTPELYANSWFICLFANRCLLEVLFYLWDVFICELATQPHLFYYVSLALLIANRAMILKTSDVSLPEFLSTLTIANKTHAYTLIQRAKQLYSVQTSRSWEQKLYEMTSGLLMMEKKKEVASPSPMPMPLSIVPRIDSREYVQLIQWPCIGIQVDELLQQIIGDNKNRATPSTTSSTTTTSTTATTTTATTGTTNTTPSMKWFILDCRSLEEYQNGHLPMSFHLDPELLEERRSLELEARLHEMEALRGCHLCFLDGGQLQTTAATPGGNSRGEGVEESTTPPGTTGTATSPASGATPPTSTTPTSLSTFLSSLLRRHFKYCCFVVGGYPVCHARILALDRASELLDHHPDVCLECSGRLTMKKEKKPGLSLLSSMKRIGKEMMATMNVNSSTSSSISNSLMVSSSSSLLPSQLSLFTPEFKRDNFPDALTLLPTTIQIRLFMTVVRDRQSDDSVFAACVDGLTSLLLAAAMERCDTRARHVNTASGGLFAGITNASSVCTLPLTPITQSLLTHCWSPYLATVPRFLGRLVFDDPPSHALIDSTLPDAADLPVYRVWLFVPFVQPDNLHDILSVVSHLIACGCAVNQVLLLCHSIARPCAWSLYLTHPTLSIISITYDEVKHNTVVPGLNQLEERWQKGKKGGGIDNICQNHHNAITQQEQAHPLEDKAPAS